MTNIERQSRQDMLGLLFWFVLGSVIGGAVGGTIVAAAVLLP